MTDNETIKSVYPLGDKLRKFIEEIRKLNPTEDTEKILALLPNTRIRDGYKLGLYTNGDESFGYSYKPFAQRADGKEERCPTAIEEDRKYLYFICPDSEQTPSAISEKNQDSYYFTNRCGIKMKAVPKPPIISYFTIPFTQEGILEAWILTNLEDFLPKFWHANYTSVDFICGSETILELFPEKKVTLPIKKKRAGKRLENLIIDTSERDQINEKVRSMDVGELVPKIAFTDDGAILKYCFWTIFGGLYSVEVHAVKEGDSIKLSKPNKTCLLEYRSSIIF